MLRAEMAEQEAFSPEFEQNRKHLINALHEQTIAGVENKVPVSSSQAPPSQAGSQSAFVDPSTGKIVWRAIACYNPRCPGNGQGGLVLVTRPLPNVSAKPNGEMSILPLDPKELEALPCPVCGSTDFMRPYETPQAIAKREDLERELQAYYDAKRKNPKQTPAGLRTPKVIMEELSKLDAVFLREK